MISIKALITPIPDGIKIELLGTNYVKGLINYYEKNTSSEIDLDELILRDFNQLILDNKFIKLLKLWSEESLLIILNLVSLKSQTENKIKLKIIDYYNLKYDEVDKIDNIYLNKTDCEIPLHDFQERMRRKVINLIFNNEKRFLIHMPTGSGKTRTAGEIILDFIRLSSSQSLLNEKMKILWIAQSGELCYQAYETIKWLIDSKGTKNISLAHFYGNENLSVGIENESAIIFCSIQKLLLHYTEPIWNKIRSENYLVIVDEAHRSVAEQWIQALNFFVNNKSVYLLGLSATPGLGTKTNDATHHLSTYYHGNKISLLNEKYIPIERPIHYLVEREFLAKINRITINSDITINDERLKTDVDEFQFTTKTLKELSVNPSRNTSIINIITSEFKRNRKILVFTCGLEHNRILQSLLLENNIQSATVDQNTKNRTSIINRFKEGDLMILLNYGVLTTGFDAPKTDVCLIARPINSIVMYSQMVGRILRGPKNKGNRENTLYTIKDNLNHGDYDEMFTSFDEFYT
jgi:superfamily II DNA or RNA helicase